MVAPPPSPVRAPPGHSVPEWETYVDEFLADARQDLFQRHPLMALQSFNERCTTACLSSLLRHSTGAPATPVPHPQPASPIASPARASWHRPPDYAMPWAVHPGAVRQRGPVRRRAGRAGRAGRTSRARQGSIPPASAPPKFTGVRSNQTPSRTPSQTPSDAPSEASSTEAPSEASSTEAPSHASSRVTSRVTSGEPSREPSAGRRRDPSVGHVASSQEQSGDIAELGRLVAQAAASGRIRT